VCGFYRDNHSDEPESIAHMTPAKRAEIIEAMARSLMGVTWQGSEVDAATRALNAALACGLGEPEWQPIAIADRSGDWVVLWAEGLKPAPFYWEPSLVRWVQGEDENAAFWHEDSFGPTHWQPLPPPPKEK
jgi:hypothetical protein